MTGAYDDAAGLDPQALGPAAHYFLGLGRLQLGDAAGALVAFEHACALSPGAVDALLQVALVADRFTEDSVRTGEGAAAQRGAKERALRAFQRVGAAMLASAGGDDAAAAASGGGVGLRRHEFPQQAAGRREREASEAAGGLVEVHLRIGQLAREVGDKAVAVDALGLVLTFDEGSKAAAAGLASLHGDVATGLFWRGTAAAKHGDLQGAEGCLREALLLQPAWAEARRALGQALHRRGKHLEALSLGQQGTGPGQGGLLLGQAQNQALESAGAAAGAGAAMLPEASAAQAHARAQAFFKKEDMVEALAHAEQALEDNRCSSGNGATTTSTRAATVDLAIGIAAELADSPGGGSGEGGSSAPVVASRVARALRAAATHAFKLGSDDAAAGDADAGAGSKSLGKVNALAASWVERGLLGLAAVGYEAVLEADHEATSLPGSTDASATAAGAVGAMGAAASTRGPRSAAALEALDGLRLTAAAAAASSDGAGVSAASSGAEALRLRCDEFAALPSAVELRGPAEEARQQSGRGDFDGAIATFQGLLRLKGTLAVALCGLVGVSKSLRRQRRFDQALAVCKLVRTADPAFSPGAAELAKVHCALGDLELFRASSSGGSSSASASTAAAAACFDEAISVAAEGCPDEGCVEALFKRALLDIAGGASGSSGGASGDRWVKAAAGLPSGKATVHLGRALALLKIYRPAGDRAAAFSDGGGASLLALPPAAASKLLEQVKADLSRAVGVKPSSPPTTFLALAEACARTDDHKAATAFLASALERIDAAASPGLAAHAQVLLGTALEALGQTAAAVEATEAAAALDPSYANLGLRLRAVRGGST